jgi:hypothetical protein
VFDGLRHELPPREKVIRLSDMKTYSSNRKWNLVAGAVFTALNRDPACPLDVPNFLNFQDIVHPLTLEENEIELR